ncbi:MAG: rhodanese-like domain-containing protein [Deltaproteobacteria bacterium]|nr:rhodanese-like domain-containing protein [Deltaproteobacteria bacterium]
MAPAVLFGLWIFWPLIGVAHQGELPSYLFNLRQEKRRSEYAGIKIINLDQAYALFNQGQALFVDVRKPYQYEEEHIPGAVSLPLDDWKKNKNTPLPYIPKDRLIVTYCIREACYAHLEMAKILQAQGFTQVMAYLGGFREWEKAGYPKQAGLSLQMAGKK